MVKIGFRKYHPAIQQATLEEKYEILKWYMEKYPKAAKSLFGYKKQEDTITEEFMKPIVEFLEIIKLTI